jgi:AcrR family transcriptional regulator
MSEPMAAPAHRPGRPKQLTDEQRQALLLDAAEHVFLDNGYHASTMADVALRAKMSKKTIYQIFPTKDALFAALLSDRLSSLTVPPIEDDDDDLAKSLENLLTSLGQIILSPQQIRLSRLMISEGWRAPEMARGFDQTGLGRGGGALEKWLARQVSKGRLLIKDPIKASKMLYGLALGDTHMFLLMSMRAYPSPEEIRARVAEAVALFLNGVDAIHPPFKPPPLPTI